MPDYAMLRNIVSHRVTFEYDNGARIVGYVGQTKPDAGPVQALLLSKALLISADRTIVGKRDEMSLVPNLLASAHKDGAKVVLEFDSGAKLVGLPKQDDLADTEFQTLTDVVIHDATGRVLEQHDELVAVPRPLLQWRISEGPMGL